MSVELAVAALGCLVLAAGHAAVGRWVLPSLKKGALSGTPFGPPAMSVGMVRFTWSIVTILLGAFSVLLLTLALDPHIDTRALLLRWFTAFWLAATVLALWNARRRLSSILRLPVPFVFVIIAAMCWKASL